MLHKLLSKDERTIALEVASQAAATVQGAATTGNGTQSIRNSDGTRTVTGPGLVPKGGVSPTQATHVGDVTPPGVPTGISATSTSGMLTVRWDGTLTGGVPGDFAHVSVTIDGPDGTEALGSLTHAGDLTAAGLTEGETYRVTATAEDDACLADGTPAHNVSAATTPIDVTIAASGGTDDEARRLAQEALDSATATSQFFWSDDSGAHVSTQPGDAAGASNVLINALGILLRAAQNNLLALTTSGITLYDGQGNEDSNVVATFTGSGVELGKNSMESAIKMCGGSLMIHTREVSGSPYVDGLTWIGNVSDRSNVTMRGGAAVGLTIGGSEDETSDVYMGLQHAEAGVLDSPPVSIVTGVQKHVVSAATVDLYADSVHVSNQAMTSSVTAPMSRAVRLLSDTGWTWLADYGSGHGIRWRCVAGVVHLQAAIYGEHTVGTGGWDAGTIPADYCPSSDVAVAGVSFGALTNPTQLRAGSDGKVNLWAPSDTNFFGGSLSYPLEA